MLNENYRCIYKDDRINGPYYSVIKPMFEKLYNRFVDDIKSNNYSSPVYKHYLNGTTIGNYYRNSEKRYVDLEKNTVDDIVVDFIASMTDDYFVDVYEHLFPESELCKGVVYIEYFDKKYL
jgi:dGTP triphosphohydrolase